MNIELRGVSKSYRRQDERIDVLREATIAFADGSSTAIVGPSGSGKTTLLTLIAGLDNPDQGDVLVGDQKMNQLSEEERTALRCTKIGIVFQRFHLIPTLSAWENVALPLEINKMADVNARTAQSLKSVGLENRAHHLPSELSGGESQRIAIARALIHRPRLILADEPSGNLDAHTGDKIMDLLFALCADNGTTLVLVTHNLKHAERCARVLTLREGKLT